MNNDTIRHQYDTFQRIQAFGQKHGDAFTPESRATRLFTDMSSLVTSMDSIGVSKLSGKASFHGGTSQKQLAAELVREDLAAIRETAVAIAEAEDTPDFDDQFRLPRSSSYDVLLTRAKAFLADATPHEALFLEFEMPADFLQDLAADIQLLETADDSQDAGLAQQVANTAELAAAASQGMKIRKQLNAIVKNKFRQDPGILAEWSSAQHITWPSSEGEAEADQ